MEEEVEIVCPYCGETVSIMVDTTIQNLNFIEDCSVCCKPIQLDAQSEEGQLVSIEAVKS